MLHHCRVVLVRPKIAANLGATARIMRNMGLTDLILVAPEADPSDREARRLSTHGDGILDRCRVVPDLGQAVGDCALVVATSARTGGSFRRQSVGPPDEIAGKLTTVLSRAPAAIVFGPESSGLENEEASRCHYLIHIPADESYPALNLAQAVGICLYELRRARLRQNAPTGEPASIATFADRERMFEHLKTALEEIHFLYGPSADSLMHALRHLISRALPRPMEVDLLHGLARQLRWYASRHAPPPKP
jgi:tRNA/rRNA methyltransferase